MMSRVAVVFSARRTLHTLQHRAVHLGVAAAIAVPVVLAGPGPAHAAADLSTHHRWVAAWGTSPTGPGTFAEFACPSETGLQDQTVRNIVFTSAGGDHVRVRLTNTFGARPLRVGHAAVALADGGAATVPGTTRPLTFGGATSVTLPAGTEALSDPVPLRVPALHHLAVSVYLPEATGPATQHLFALQDNYLATGDAAVSEAASSFPTTINCWLFTDGVDVYAQRRFEGAVVALGNSITDGAGSTSNADHRWPDQLARRLNARGGPTLSVVNAGIAGNEVLIDRLPPQFGQSALSRLDRDVLTETRVRVVILLEGINDIGGDHASAERLIAAYQQIIAQVRAQGLRIFGGTLTPFVGSNAQYGGDYGTPWGEEQRQAVNRWIRTAGAFDGVIDFDKATADPADPQRLNPAYHSGDYLHPNDAGYLAMARAIDLQALIHSCL
jgi:lysophospholipase L1-like esterase